HRFAAAGYLDDLDDAAAPCRLHPASRAGGDHVVGLGAVVGGDDDLHTVSSHTLSVTAARPKEAARPPPARPWARRRTSPRRSARSRRPARGASPMPMTPRVAGPSGSTPTGRRLLRLREARPGRL